MGNATASAVNDTTKWVKEQSESFGTEMGSTHTMLPGQTIQEVAETNNLKVVDLIKFNRLTSRKQLYAGKDLIIPCSDFFPVSPHPLEHTQLEALRILDSGERQFGRLAFSLREVFCYNTQKRKSYHLADFLKRTLFRTISGFFCSF